MYTASKRLVMVNQKSKNRSSDGTFRGEGLGTRNGDKPISCMYPPEMRAFLMALPHKAQWLREAAKEKRDRQQRIWEFVGEDAQRLEKLNNNSDVIRALGDISGDAVNSLDDEQDCDLISSEENKLVLLELSINDIEWLSSLPGGALPHIRQAIACYRASFNGSRKKSN